MAGWLIVRPRTVLALDDRLETRRMG